MIENDATSVAKVRAPQRPNEFSANDRSTLSSMLVAHHQTPDTWSMMRVAPWSC